MSLAKLALFTEESPWWCWLHRFRVPPPVGPFPRWDAALGPQPLPPHPEMAAALWQALRLHRHAELLTAHNVGGDAADGLMRAATRLYDEAGCGNVPWQVLMQWLRDPPPTPPPWLDLVGQAVANAVIASRMGGDFGRQLGAAASSVIAESVGVRNAA